MMRAKKQTEPRTLDAAALEDLRCLAIDLVSAGEDLQSALDDYQDEDGHQDGMEEALGRAEGALDSAECAWCSAREVLGLEN